MGAHRMIGRARWLVACVVAALLLAACSGSDGSTAPPPGLRLHTLTATASLGGTTEPLTERVRLALPSTWRTVTATSGRLRMREGSAGCTYTVDVRAAIRAIDAASATGAVRSVTPTADGHLLEAGRRGSAAWRIVKERGDGVRVRLGSARAQPLRWTGERAHRPMWLVVEIDAASDPGDECHAGTYRDTLAPAIGDALATARRLP